MRRVAVTICALSLAGCGAPSEPVDFEACDYFHDGPFTPITAGIAMDETAPVVVPGPGAYTVVMPSEGLGYLAFETVPAGDYAIFTDRAIDIAVLTLNGANVFPFEVLTSSGACGAIERRTIVGLFGGTYPLAFGPDPDAAFELVLLPYVND